MATSGTYSFNPSTGSLILQAYSRCGIRRTALQPEHMQDAFMECNLLLTEWANDQPNLWVVDLQTTPLVQGITDYDVPDNTVLILDAWITTDQGQGQPTDRIISPLGRSEYAALPNKEQEGFPTSYWFDRKIDSTITIWPVPDNNGPYILNYYRVRQIQDAAVANGVQMEIPYRFFDAFCWGLAARLAAIYAPDKAVALDARAERAWKIASEADVELVPLYITPGLNSYYR